MHLIFRILSNSHLIAGRRIWLFRNFDDMHHIVESNFQNMAAACFCIICSIISANEKYTKRVI